MKILDCTIRDGGYYNQWDFDDNLVSKYINYMNILPIDFVEIGYRSIKKNNYHGRYFYLPKSTLVKIKKSCNKKLSIMLNAKDCKIDNILSLISDLKKDVDLIRIATDPAQISYGKKLAFILKNHGFTVALNIMYISKLKNNDEFFDQLSDIDKHVDILNLVDSYGSVYPNELKHLFNKVKLKTSIPLGFHGHNNLELAFINSLVAIECGIEFLDCTVLGMGRGAGNLKTELLLIYLQSKKNYRFNANLLGELVEIFTPLKNTYDWGTNLAYQVSGSYSIPQKQVMDALEIERYSISGILNKLKLNISSSKSITKIFKPLKFFKEALIVGGGISVYHHKDEIFRFIKENPNILIIFSTVKYVELFSKIKNIKYFALTGDDINNIKNKKKIDKFITEPNLFISDQAILKKNDICRLSKISFINEYHDSPLAVGLQLCLEIRSNKVYLAGFDGYNNFKNKKELFLIRENQSIFDNYLKKNKNLMAITSTFYKNLIGSSVYCL